VILTFELGPSTSSAGTSKAFNTFSNNITKVQDQCMYHGKLQYLPFHTIFSCSHSSFLLSNCKYPVLIFIDDNKYE
jgi:hypothetical protein